MSCDTVISITVTRVSDDGRYVVQWVTKGGGTGTNSHVFRSLADALVWTTQHFTQATQSRSET
jgi:hypothetical protein